MNTLCCLVSLFRTPLTVTVLLLGLYLGDLYVINLVIPVLFSPLNILAKGAELTPLKNPLKSFRKSSLQMGATIFLSP